MPRYFFHLFDDIVLRDEEGIELPDIEAARSEAVRAARDIACQEVQNGKLSLHHRIEVEDEQGRPILTLPFKAAFKIEDRSGG
ncbi:MAG: hypothetical protein JWN69_665 [Alphaproteobacteria bacterium]|nr:hypothetical protein [Alphaproteobacteria bacterium]